MKRKAFTLVELMCVLILMTLVLTYLWKVFSAANKGANEVISNHQINDEIDRTMIKITDDIREANAIDADYPPIYEQSDIANLKTSDENNQLRFIKVDYDFSKDPSTLGDDEVNYTSIQVRYYLEKEDSTKENSKWLLNREMTPIDSNMQLVESGTTVYNILSGIDECIFYRVKDPDAARTGNVYIDIKLGRKDNGKYANEATISVKERGSLPAS